MPPAARAILLGLVAAALAVLPPATAQADGCDVDRALVDAGADGTVSIGDPFVSLPGPPGPSTEAGRLDQPALALGGTLAFFDQDGDGALSKGEPWALDRGAAGPTVGDVLLGDAPTNGSTLSFGTVLRVGGGAPGGSLRAAPGAVLAFVDDSGDGVRQPGEGLYAVRGATVQPNDVRLWVEGFEPGSAVASTDPDRGAAAVAGPRFAFFDADGSGTFVVPDCAHASPPPSASESSGPSGDGGTTRTASTTYLPGGCPEQMASCPPSEVPPPQDGGEEQAPVSFVLPLTALAIVLWARRRLP